MIGSMERWLGHLSDPSGLNSRWVGQRFEATADIADLLELAHRHNVRPAVVANLETSLRKHPETIFRKPDPQIIEETLKKTREARLIDVGRAAFLAQTADTLLLEVQKAGLPVVLVKGPEFARSAYGGLHNTTFSDLDFLCRPDAEEDFGHLLIASGFAEQPDPSRSNRTERSWVRKSGVSGPILVETHTDLGHTAELRKVQSLTGQH